MLNIHATLISYKNKGILFIGKSGSGKSDLALRMIMAEGAVLVADDRVDLFVNNNKLYGYCPKEIKGKLEIRNVGIVDFDTIENAEISLVVELSKFEDLERLPWQEFETYLGISVPRIKLFAFEISAIYKIIAKISSIIS